MSNPPFIASFTDIETLLRDKAGWAALARAALEPNPFYEADFLAAAERHLERGARLKLLVVRDATASAPVGLFPLRKPRWREGILFDALSLYTNEYSSLSTPLVRAEGATEILDTAFRFLAGKHDIPQVLHFGKLAGNRPFHALLLAHAEATRLPVLTVARHDRAAIETHATVEAYRAHDNASTRKSLNRKQKRLEALGTLTFAVIPGDTPDALAGFLALEASGWKGHRGTALAIRPDTRAFAETALSPSAGHPRLFFECLRLDGRPIAMNLNLRSQDAAFTFKTAYDEAFAAYSPGALLDRQSVTLVAAGGDLARFDSCADPHHRIEALWHERETIATLLVGVSPAIAGEELAPIAARMQLAARVIESAKALRARFAGRT